MEGQKLEWKSKSTHTLSCLPSDICRYYKKSGHWKYNCPILKEIKEKGKMANLFEHNLKILCLKVWLGNFQVGNSKIWPDNSVS